MNFFALLLDPGMKSDIMPLAPKTENKKWPLKLLPSY